MCFGTASEFPLSKLCLESWTQGPAGKFGCVITHYTHAHGSCQAVGHEMKDERHVSEETLDADWLQCYMALVRRSGLGGSGSNYPGAQWEEGPRFLLISPPWFGGRYIIFPLLAASSLVFLTQSLIFQTLNKPFTRLTSVVHSLQNHPYYYSFPALPTPSTS